MIVAIISRVLPVLLMLIYVGIIIYFVLLAGRLVRAVEKIADKIDNIRAPSES